MTTLHRRKRVEIVVESARLDEVLDLVVHEAGASGYTVLPTLGGSGNRGRRANDLTGVGGNVLVVVLARAEVAETLVGLLAEQWGHAIGVLSVCDVEVLRPEKF